MVVMGDLVTSILGMIQSCLSPAVLFVLLNIVIGTIVITSKSFFRSPAAGSSSAAPSSALERLRSVGNIYRYRSGDLSSVLSNPFDGLNNVHEEYNNSSEGGPTRVPSILERLYRYGSGEIQKVNDVKTASTVDDSSPQQKLAPAPVPSILERLYRYGSGEIQKVNDVKTASTADDSSPQQKLARAPSVLERLRSVGGLSRYLSGEIPKEDTVQQSVDDSKAADRSPESPPKLARAPSVLDRLKSSIVRYTSGEFNFDQPPLPPEAFFNKQAQHKNKYDRCQSETRPKQKKAPAPAAKVKKSASAKAAAPSPEDEVDARADDFINRFRQELQLQRLNSLLQYKETLDRSK